MKKHLLLLLFCFSIFTLTAQNQDCTTALEIFTKDSIIVDELQGSGDIKEEYMNICVNGSLFESESTWYKFTATKSGTLNFIVKPHIPTNDLDFYMFEATKGDCSELKESRCNASSCVGETGYTGLSADDIDTFEDLNCEDGENGFCKEIIIAKDETYYLMVNNFSNNGGYNIVFCGTALLSDQDNVCTNEVMNVEQETFSQIEISPNPTTGKIFISNAHLVSNIQVYNTQGQMISNINAVENEINLEVNPGLYYLKANFKNGGSQLKSILIN